jgi:hypothetical protein
MLILLAFKNTKKIRKKNQNLKKNKEVEGPMCFGDQATLLINRGHNTHKREWGRKFTRGNFEKFRARQKTLKNFFFLHLYQS